MLADPRDPDPKLRDHREVCHDCSRFTERLMDFESRLGRALRVAPPVPTDSGGTVVPLRPTAPRRAPRAAYRKGWVAVAASVLVAVMAGGLWLSVPDRSLAADVVTHVKEEPQAWRTDVPVPRPALEDVLRDSHLRLAADAGVVSYASSCEFRGHLVPHLVMQTAAGPVTVMVLVHEHASKEMQFDEQGYRGVIVPVAGHGSLAVLTRGGGADSKAIDEIASRVQGFIVWTG
jgi:hypothetical protein